MSTNSQSGSENERTNSNSSEVKSIHQNIGIPANNMNKQLLLPSQSLAKTDAPSLNQSKIIISDSQNEPKHLFDVSQLQNELQNSSLFQNDKKEKPEEEINSKENKKFEGEQGYGKEKVKENEKKENESIEKNKKSEDDKKFGQHNVSAEYQFVSNESLNNLCGKIGSLIEEMKELNINQSNLLKLLVRKFFSEELESQGSIPETGNKK